MHCRNAAEIKEAGADQVCILSNEAGLNLGSQVLQGLGTLDADITLLKRGISEAMTVRTQAFTEQLTNKKPPPVEDELCRKLKGTTKPVDVFVINGLVAGGTSLAAATASIDALSSLELDSMLCDVHDVIAEEDIVMLPNIVEGVAPDRMPAAEAAEHVRIGCQEHGAASSHTLAAEHNSAAAQHTATPSKNMDVVAVAGGSNGAAHVGHAAADTTKVGGLVTEEVVVAAQVTAAAPGHQA